MRIASYLKNNPLIQELADWFREESGRDDFYIGTYTDGEAFIKIEEVEIPYRSAIKFIRDKQLKLFK